MGEHISSSPQQLSSCGLHFFTKVIRNFIQRAAVGIKMPRLWAYICIVPAEVRHAQQLKHFKGHVRFDASTLHVVLWVPRPFKGLATKGVTALPSKGVPVSHCKTQVLFHSFAHDNLIRIIVVEGHWIIAVWSLKGYFFNALKKLCHASAFNAGYVIL